MKGRDTRHLLNNPIYMDFKNRPKELTVVEVRIVVLSGMGQVTS